MQKGRKMLAQQRKYHRHHPMNHMATQLEDHENDTDDIPLENENVQIDDHENDTDDVPEDQDPVMVALNNGEGWKGFFKGQDSDFKAEKDAAVQQMDDTYAQEEEDETFEFVQLNDKIANKDHENDTDDIPEGQDPVGLAQRDHHYSAS